MKYIFEKLFPFIIILIVWLGFAYPYFLQHKIPYPGDYLVTTFAPWSAYPQFGMPVKNGAMPDVITQIYPWKHLAIETWKSGQIPLWNPYSFSGTPQLANYQSAVLSPFNVLFFVLPFVNAWAFLILLQPLLAGIFMYLFVRNLKISAIGSILSSVAFMFCGFIVVWMDYGTLAYAILFLPLALFSVKKYFDTDNIWYLFLLSLTFPLSFFSGHFQMSGYFALVVILYILYFCIVSKNTRQKLTVVFFAFCGALLTLPQVLPAMEFYGQALRSTIFGNVETIPWGYLPTFLSPDFYGNPVTRNDWFGHYAEWNAYIGVWPLLLGIYGMFSRKRKETLFFIIAGIVSMLLAFPTPLLSLLIMLHVPVFSTSSASRIIVIFSFAFAVLAGFGFDQLLVDIKEKQYKKIILLLSFGLGTFLVLWAIVGFKLFLTVDKLHIARQNLIPATGIFMVGIISILLATLGRRFVLRFAIYALIFLTVFDMLRFATKWQPYVKKDLFFPTIPVAKEFQKIQGYERALGNYQAEAAVYFHLPAPDGYDALYIRRYGQFAESINEGKVQDAERSVVTFPKNSKETSLAINLLNIRYIVHKVSDDHMGWTFGFWNYPISQFNQIYKDPFYEIYRNTAALPHAFLVGKYVVEKNPQKIIDALYSPAFDLRSQIVVEEDPKLGQNKEFSGDATITSYTPDRVAIITNANRSGLLFLSDNDYPGWQATVDNKPAKIYRADYSFRSIVVPAGKHIVVFKYVPMSFWWGVWLAIFGVVGMIIFLVFPKTSNQ